MRIAGRVITCRNPRDHFESEWDSWPRVPTNPIRLSRWEAETLSDEMDNRAHWCTESKWIYEDFAHHGGGWGTLDDQEEMVLDVPGLYSLFKKFMPKGSSVSTGYMEGRVLFARIRWRKLAKGILGDFKEPHEWCVPSLSDMAEDLAFFGCTWKGVHNGVGAWLLDTLYTVLAVECGVLKPRDKIGLAGNHLASAGVWRKPRSWTTNDENTFNVVESWVLVAVLLRKWEEIKQVAWVCVLDSCGGPAPDLETLRNRPRAMPPSGSAEGGWNWEARPSSGSPDEQQEWSTWTWESKSQKTWHEEGGGVSSTEEPSETGATSGSAPNVWKSRKKTLRRSATARPSMKSWRMAGALATHWGQASPSH